MEHSSTISGIGSVINCNGSLCLKGAGGGQTRGNARRFFHAPCQRAPGGQEGGPSRKPPIRTGGPGEALVLTQVAPSVHPRPALRRRPEGTERLRRRRQERGLPACCTLLRRVGEEATPLSPVHKLSSHALLRHSFPDPLSLEVQPSSHLVFLTFPKRVLESSNIKRRRFHQSLTLFFQEGFRTFRSIRISNAEV